MTKKDFFSLRCILICLEAQTLFTILVELKVTQKNVSRNQIKPKYI
jgi:hypothetical protein